jgi:hypothetical protein
MPNGLRRLGTLLAILALVATVLVSGASTRGDAAEVEPQLICNPAPTGPAPEPVSGGFHAVTPVRVLDTRLLLGPIDAGCTAVVDLHGLVEPAASGVALDVITVDAADRGFVTAYPCDTDRPLASNLNPRVADPTPNVVVVPLLTSRRVCLYSSVHTHLVADLTGWFGPGGASFHGMTPERALDTRFGPRPDGGSGQLLAGQTLTLPIAGLGSVPSGAIGVAVNLTVTNTVDPGFITAYPCNVPRPFTSNGNYLANDTRANQALIGLDGAGRLCIYTLATVDLVVDVSGWFSGTDGTRLEPVVGTRVVDSRDGTGGWSGPLATGQTRSFDPTLGGTVAVGANAVLDVVATEATGNGFLTLYPCGTPRPPTSSVNYEPGNEATNFAAVAVGGDGRICVYAHVTTHVVIDVLGSFGPAGSLRDLSVSPGTLVPPFARDAHDYGVVCASGDNSWHVSAAAVPGATVMIAGADASGNLTVHENDLVEIAVQLPGGGVDHYFVRCLPHDFPTLAVDRPDDPSPGWYLLSSGLGAAPGTGSYALILDDHGAPVWYQKRPATVIDVKRLPNGHLAWTPLLGGAFGVIPDGAYEERDLDGSLVRTWATVGSPTDHHELLPLSNGNMLMASYHFRSNVDVTALGGSFTSPANVVDAWIQEIKPDGTVAWEWHSEDHIAVAETSAQVDGVNIVFNTPQGPVVDLVHLNSLDVDLATGNVIMSARHLDAVVEIRRNPGQPDDGKVLWKLGGKAPTDPLTKHLSIIGDAFNGPRRQHDARVLPNGHVAMFDNESNHAGAPARGVEYALDLDAGTATLVWQYARPDGANSPAQGSTRRLADGSSVIGWGVFNDSFVDLEPFGHVALAVKQMPQGYSYRVVKEPKASFDVAILRANAGK